MINTLFNIAKTGFSQFKQCFCFLDIHFSYLFLKLSLFKGFGKCFWIEHFHHWFDLFFKTTIQLDMKYDSYRWGFFSIIRGFNSSNFSTYLLTLPTCDNLLNTSISSITPRFPNLQHNNSQNSTHIIPSFSNLTP